MEGKREVEGDEWELLHPNDGDDPIVLGGPPLDSIRPDHFSLLDHPDDNTHIPNSTSSSSSSSDLDRNFDDSYVANQLFPNSNPTLAPWTGDSDSDTANAAAPEEDKTEQEEEKRLVWWKLPFEVLRYWVNPLPLPLPLSLPLPVWSLSLAAFLGLFFLGRRLYRMKRKTQTFKLNLALDDKKVSQLMGRVARLNEAFSVVRRVPIVRPPSLPASSVTLRPVMSLR
ncbi:hypothetical protein CR513_51156, partial [Mucuna pruriens]